MTYGLHGTDLNFVHKRIIKAATSFVTGGFSPTAAAAGFLTGGGGGGKTAARAARVAARASRQATNQARAARIAARAQRVASRAPRPVSRLAAAAATGAPTALSPAISRLSNPAAASAGRCGFGFIRVGGRCVPLGAAPAAGIIDLVTGGRFRPKPPTSPSRSMTTVPRQDFGQAVVGAFGMPAMVPAQEMRMTLVCPRGMVLGTDDLCYPKGVLSSRNLHRKWRRPPRPVISAGDARAIRVAAAAKDRVLKLAKDVGLHASKNRPAPKSKGHQHLLAPPSQVLRVIAEETN